MVPGYYDKGEELSDPLERFLKLNYSDKESVFGKLIEDDIIPKTNLPEPKSWSETEIKNIVDTF